jgi:hypothetical protein
VKSSLPLPGIEPHSSSPYTDWDVPASPLEDCSPSNRQTTILLDDNGEVGTGRP